jgi:hypothetical protein
MSQTQTPKCATCGEERTANGGDLHCVGDCDWFGHGEPGGCHPYLAPPVVSVPSIAARGAEPTTYAETPKPEEGEITDEQCREFALAYLDAAIAAGRGPVTFAMTEMGNVGIWIFDDGENAKAHGTGDTAEEALISAAYNGLLPEIAAAAKETK